MPPLVSVIITTKNEEKNIENCLKSIQNQTYKNIEIIVVDNHSIDKTQEIASRLIKRVFDLKKEIKVTEVKNFRGAQLNLGVNKAKGNIIFFPDADMSFDKELFSDAVDKLTQSDALYVPEIVSGKGYFGKIRNFERSFYNETSIDGVRFVRKKVFMEVGGFDDKNIVFGPDDWDFTKTLKKYKYVLRITHKPLYHHEESLTLMTYLKKKSKYASTFQGYVDKWGKDDEDIRKQFGFWYRYFIVFAEKGKWKKMLAHPFLTLGMFIVRFLVGINYISKKFN